jgi:hypothetical protein
MAITTSQYNTSHLAIVNTDIFTCGSVGYDTSATSISSSYTKSGDRDDNFAYGLYGQSICLHSSRLYVLEDIQIKIFREAGSSGSNVGVITTSDQSSTSGEFNSIVCGCGRIVAGQRISSGTANTVYVFDLLGGNEIKLPISNGRGTTYGQYLGVGCGRIVVGDEYNNQVYVHDLQGREIKILTPHDTLPSGASYGYPSVGSGRIVVGAGGGNTNGAVYVYDLHGTFLFKLSSPYGNNERFGVRTAVGDGRIIVSAIAYSGTYSNDGKVYVYDLNGNSLFDLVPPNAYSGGQSFGLSVAVGCGKIIIGAPYYNGTAGRATVYNLDGDLLRTFTGNGGYNMGHSVAISNTQSGTMYAISQPRIGSTGVTSYVSWYFMDDLNQVHYLDQLNDR